MSSRALETDSWAPVILITSHLPAVLKVIYATFTKILLQATVHNYNIYTQLTALNDTKI